MSNSCIRCKKPFLDDYTELGNICVTCKSTFYIVQARVYTKSIIEKPRKYFWEDMPKWDFSELGGTQETKRFKTREQAERAIRRYIRKHCYNDYASNHHRYRIVRCEVVT